MNNENNGVNNQTSNINQSNGINNQVPNNYQNENSINTNYNSQNNYQNFFNSQPTQPVQTPNVNFNNNEKPQKNNNIVVGFVVAIVAFAIGYGGFYAIKHFTSNNGNSTERKIVDINKMNTYNLESLTFQLPYEYTKSKYSIDNTLLMFDIDSDYDLSVCEFQALVDEVYLSLEEQIEYEETIEDDFNMALLKEFYQPFNIETKMINGKEWKYALAKSIENKDFYYETSIFITEYNSKRYQFKYTNFTPKRNLCESLANKVINSLTLN